MSVTWGSMTTGANPMMNFVKAVLVGVAIFLGVQVGRDLAHKTMSATTSALSAQ